MDEDRLITGLFGGFCLGGVFMLAICFYAVKSNRQDDANEAAKKLNCYPVEQVYQCKVKE